MRIIILFLIIIIVVMLYIGLAYYFTPKSTITKKIYLANGIPNVPLGDLPSIGISKYSYELWVYVNHIDAAAAPTENKYGRSNPGGNIFTISSPDDFTAALDIYKDGSAKLKLGEFDIPITDKFPLQRWEYLIINIDNNFVEIYLDGKLLRSMKIPNTIPTPTVKSSLGFGTGDIYISAFNRNIYTIDQKTAFKNYLNGNNGWRFSNYGVSFDFLKNSDVAYNYSLI